MLFFKKIALHTSLFLIFIFSLAKFLSISLLRLISYYDLYWSCRGCKINLYLFNVIIA